MILPLKHILIKLLPKSFVSGDVEFTYDNATHKIKSEHLELDMELNHEPAYWASDRGVVVASCNSEIRPGDLAFVEYLGVTNALGRWFEPLATVDDPHYILNGRYNGIWSVPDPENYEGLYVFIPERFVIWVEREGKEIAVNDFNVIEIEEKEQSSLLQTEKKPTQIARVVVGDFKGNTIAYPPSKVYGAAQHLRYKGKKVQVILGRYIDSLIETE